MLAGPDMDRTPLSIDWQNRAPMLEAIASARSEALNRIQSVEFLDELHLLQTELFGKKSPLAEFKTRLGSRDPDERKQFGRALNEVTDALNAALAAKRSDLAAVARSAQIESERMDLTEVVYVPRRGHVHPVTQAWERLEDVFVGLGFTVEEGPEVEDDFHNFEALNMPPSHPARSMWDTLFVNLGQPGQVMLRTHTSPVQVRLMQSRPPPFACVMPGRTFRRETADVPVSLPAMWRTGTA